MQVDLIVLADTVHTLTGNSQPIQAVAICDGVVVAVGNRDDAAEWRSARTEVLDLGAAVLTPGLTDAHAHPLSGVQMARGVDLSGAQDLRTARDLIARDAHGRGPDEWVLGWGLDPNIFGALPVTSSPFEEVLGGRPAFLRVFDAHSALASSTALRLAGVDGPRVFAERSHVVCSLRGDPTGHLLEFSAMSLVQRVVPRLSLAERQDKVVRLLQDMAATGLTGVHVMDADDGPGEVLNAIEADADLPIRLRLAPICPPGSDAETVEHLVSAQGSGGRLWTVAGVKFIIDGTVDGGTAWLAEPDTLGESTDSSWVEPGSYTQIVHDLAAHGVATVTHAIGDEAVRHVVATIASAARPDSGLHRVEHLETVPDGLIPELVASGAAVGMQPTHATLFIRADGEDNWSRRLGPVRAGQAFRIRDMVDAGLTVALGSDWPVAPYDPRAIMADAQLRRVSGHPEVTPVLPHQALTGAMALGGYTREAARAAGEQDIAGAIAPGMRADLTAFAIDPLRSDPDEFAEAPIVATIVAGRVVYRSSWV